MQLYPNPIGDGQFRLRLPLALRNGPLKVRILDAKGATVRLLTLDAPATDEVPVNAGALARGTYLCEVSAGSVTQTVRFVQQ